MSQLCVQSAIFSTPNEKRIKLIEQKWINKKYILMKTIITSYITLYYDYSNKPLSIEFCAWINLDKI